MSMNVPKTPTTVIKMLIVLIPMEASHVNVGLDIVVTVPFVLVSILFHQNVIQ